MEQSPNNYRNSLAEDLKDLRSQDPKGKEDAKNFIEIARKTQRYKEAMETHLEDKRKLAESKQSSIEIIQDPVDAAFECVKSPESPLHFLFYAIGDVLGDKRETTGSDLYYFSKDTQKLVTARSVNIKNDGLFYLDSNEKGVNGRAFMSRKEDGEGIIFTCRVPFSGRSDSKCVTDDRGGVNMTGAVYIRKSQIRQLPKIVQDKLILDDKSFDKDFLLKLILKCEEEFANGYYKEVLRLLSVK